LSYFFCQFIQQERGIHLHESFEVDEETRFSSVYRGGAIDDGGHEELDDVVLSSLNSETFGGPSASSIKKSADLTHAKSNVGTRVLSTSSLVLSQIITFSLCRHCCLAFLIRAYFLLAL
jgi:hypothetical protein